MAHHSVPPLPRPAPLCPSTAPPPAMHHCAAPHSSSAAARTCGRPWRRGSSPPGPASPGCAARAGSRRPAIRRRRRARGAPFSTQAGRCQGGTGPAADNASASKEEGEREHGIWAASWRSSPPGGSPRPWQSARGTPRPSCWSGRRRSCGTCPRPGPGGCTPGARWRLRCSEREGGKWTAAQSPRYQARNPAAHARPPLLLGHRCRPPKAPGPLAAGRAGHAGLGASPARM